MVRLPAVIFRRFESGGPLAEVLQTVIQGEKGLLPAVLPSGGNFRFLDPSRRQVHLKLFALLRECLSKSHPQVMQVRHHAAWRRGALSGWGGGAGL